MGNACTHEDSSQYAEFTPRTRASMEEPSPVRLMLRHSDGTSPRPMTPEERAYLREKKRMERRRRESYVRAVSDRSAGTPASSSSPPKLAPDDASDAVARSAASALGGWGSDAAPAVLGNPPPGEQASPPRADRTARPASAARLDRITEDAEGAAKQSWLASLPFRHEQGRRNDSPLLQDVSAAIAAVAATPNPLPPTAASQLPGGSAPVLQPSTAPAHAGGLGVPAANPASDRLRPSSPTAVQRKYHTGSPTHPPSMGGLGLHRVPGGPGIQVSKGRIRSVTSPVKSGALKEKR